MSDRAILRFLCRHLLHAALLVAISAGILLPWTAFGQAMFDPLTGPNTKSFTLAAQYTPQGAAVADFNHDGYPDLVVANYNSQLPGQNGYISVYLSGANGVLQPPVTYPACGRPTAVLAEDLDLTGLPDIVVTCPYSQSNVIQVWLNLGNGTFNPNVDGITNIVLGTGAAPLGIVSGDFNNDGHPDLATANSGDGTVTLFLSNPANDFTYYTVKTLSGFGSPTAIAAGHFTNSGNLDLAVTDSAGKVVHVLTGDGTGNFTAGATVSTQNDPTAIVAGDFNRDGFTDLAVMNAGSGTVSILRGQGNGDFTPNANIHVGAAAGTGSNDLLAMDIGGNGRLDLITANPLSNQVAVLLNRANGTFEAVENYAVPNAPDYLAVGDFNRDGKPDLVVTQNGGAAVSILTNNTLPTTQPGGRNFIAPHILTHGHGNMADGIAVADFNHDGIPDIATSYLEDNTVQVLLGNGGSNFQAASVYPVGKQPYWVVAADLNNDGYPDLITANTTDGTISVLMNKADGSGTFQPAVSYPVGNLPYQLAVGDLNGDGIPDIAVADYGANTVTILYGSTSGTFGNPQTLSTCTNPYGVAIGDFRHSGQNDVAVTCFHTAQLEVFLNSGMHPYQPPPLPTTFESPEMYSTDSFPTSLVTGDFNRDGNLDIVTGNSIANDVSFFAGVGDGSFKPAVNSFALNFPDSIAAGDVNGDGIPDIVAVAANFNRATVLIGKGDGTFQPRADFTTGPQPWAVALADFNHDGKLDIATANTFNRVNITIPAYITRYMQQFPPVPGGNPSVNVLLNGSGTKIAFSASPSGTLAYNEPVTLTATVSPSLAGTATPTGSVIFEDTDGTQSPVIPLNGSGSASVNAPLLGSGVHHITVLYSGDALYQPYTLTGGAFTIRVSGTPIALTVTPNPFTPSSTVSYSATIGTPGAGKQNPVGTLTLYGILPDGTVIIADGPNLVGTPGTGGVTMFSKVLGTGIPVGNYYVYAVFQPAIGNPNPAGSSPQVQAISQ